MEITTKFIDITELGNTKKAKDVLAEICSEIEEIIPLDPDKLSYPAFFTEFIQIQFRSAPEANVLILPENTRVNGDLLLDSSTWSDSKNILAVVCKGDLEVHGDIINRSLSGGVILYVRGNLKVKNLVKSGATVLVLGDITASGIVVGEYNDGVLRVGGNLSSSGFFRFDHDGYVRGKVSGPAHSSDDEIMRDLLVDEVFVDEEEDEVCVQTLWQRSRAGKEIFR